MAEKDVVAVAPAQELSKDCNNNNNTMIVQQPLPSTSLSTTTTESMMNRTTTTVAFIVGMNHEWLHGRCLYGDIALVNTIRRFIYNNYYSQGIMDNHSDITDDVDVEECIQFMNEYNITSCHQLHDQLIQFIHRINHKYRRHNNNDSNKPLASDIQFIFYLGGHGEAGHYCVNTNNSNSNKNDDHDGDEYRWYYKDILHTLQQQLQSNDTIYMIIDTCYSGSIQQVFINQLQEHYGMDSSAVATNGTTSPSTPVDDHKWYTTIQVNDTVKIPSFFIFMSTKHNMTAGPEWTMTQGFIDAMNGTILSQQQQRQQYEYNKHTIGNGSRNTPYDPTNSKHNINNNTTKVKSYSLSTNDFIYTLHHMIQYYKENEMQFLHVYNNMNNNKICMDLYSLPFPFYCCCNTQQVHEQQQNISNETNTTNHDSSLHLIDQMQQLHIRNRYHYHHDRNTIWKRLFSSHRTKQLQQQTQLGLEYTMMYVFYLLANNGQYRYYSNENNDKNNNINSNKCNKYKPGTKVWCIYEDHTELYLGTIMNDIDVPWNDFIINDSNNNNQHKNIKRLRRKFQRKQQQQSQKLDHLIALPNSDICYGFGPCIPILWDVDHTWSFVPIGQCYVIDNNDHHTNLKNEDNNNSSRTSSNNNVIVTTKQRPKLRIVRKQAFDSLRNEIRNLTTIPTTMNITYYCIMRNFHSMGKQLCFAIQDIYNEIQHNTINDNSDECTANNESSAQYHYDSMELYFVQCPETRHLLHNLIDTPTKVNDTIKSLRTNTKSSKNKFKKNQNDMTNQPSPLYYFQIAKNMTSIYNIPLEALLTHVLYNTIPSCGMNYCIVQRYNNDSNTNFVDPKNSNHCISNDVANNDNDTHQQPKEQSHDYFCVPISSLRIVMKTRE